MLIMSKSIKSSENRVQNIKKQFEISDSNTEIDEIPRKIINSSVYTEVKKKSKHTSPGIKRSPAFRCDKIVRGGGKTPGIINTPSKPISVVNKVKLFEENGPIIKGQLKINRNNKPIVPIKKISASNFVTDNNYMTPEYKKYAICKSHEDLGSIEVSHDNDLYRSHDDLSQKNQLRKTLTDPLPNGPPPKKPPRTFAHNLQLNDDDEIVENNITHNNINKIQNKKPKHIAPKPITTTNKSPQKINKITHNLNKSAQNLNKSLQLAANKNANQIKNMNGNNTSPIRNNSKVKDISKKLNKSFDEINNRSLRHVSPPLEKRYGDIKRPTDPPPSMPARSKTESQIDLRKRKPIIPKPANKPDLSAKNLLKSCMPLNCASAHQYEPLPRRLSTKDISSPVVIPRSHSEEHIYAEPFNLNPNAGIPVKVQKQPILLTQTGKQGLYYMSTPIEETWHPRPSHLPLCPSFSTPSLSLTSNGSVRGPPTPQSPPPPQTTNKHLSSSRNNSRAKLPSPRECDELTLSSRSPSSPHKISPPRSEMMQMPLRSGSPPQKPQRSALARFASGLAKVSNVTVARSGSPLQGTELDDNRIQVLMNQAFGALQLATPDVSTDSDSLDSPVEGGFVILPNSQGSASNGHANNTKFYPSEEEEDNTEEEARKVVEMRKGYIRRTSSVAFNTAQRHKFQRGIVTPSQPGLFQCLLLVGLNYDAERRTHVPYIKSRFPENADVPQGMELFVFPDCHDWPSFEDAENHRIYCLVLTDSMGERVYGYCRRVLPEGANTCIPLAYCILTQHRASGFYHKVLAEVESRHGQPEVSRLSFLSHLHACSLPIPGHNLPLLGVNITRPPDPRLEERELAEMFSCLNDTLLIKLVASLLHERKVLLLSKSLSKLTACVIALQSALYPFSWQHTLVPALPATMIELCDAPTPFIIGLLKRKDGSFPPRLIDEGMVVDLDESRLIQCMGDEDKILPTRIRRALRLALQLVVSSTAPNETSRNVLVSEAFIRMFVEMCGHYRNHIVTQQDGKRVFERESFVKAVESPCQQMFLEWFTETAMFCAFITTRMQHTGNNVDQGIFERRAFEHLQEMEKSTLLFLKNYKAVNKKGKTFGDRIKDWSSNF